MNAKSILFTAAFFMIIFGTVQGVTLHVPGTYPTIQDAVNAAMDGDTVLVASDTYFENIDFKGKAITVTSEDGPNVTVINGSKSGSVVTFKSGEGSDSVLEGFTVTNGSGTGPMGNGCGGGIYCKGSSPTIRYNIIRGNKTYEGGGIYTNQQSSAKILDNQIINNSASYGGGMSFWTSYPEIRDNTIKNNHASQEGGGLICNMSCSSIIDNNIFSGNSAVRFGGALEFYFKCTPTVTNNLIMNNKTTQYSGGGITMGDNCSGTIKNNTITENLAGKNGGGIYLEQDCTPSIMNNTITSNSASKHGGGILFHIGSNPFIASNIILGNTAVEYGGGISTAGDSAILVNNIIANNEAEYGGGYDGWHCTPIITNNTFYGNKATTAGGAILCKKDSSMEIKNCIFWNNDAPTGPEIWIGDLAEPSSLSISYSDVDGGQASVYYESSCTLIWGAGMINDNPLFVDAVNGDLHVYCTSPCCGVGDNSAPHLPSDDFEGDPRIADGTVDMGADEFHTHLYYTGNATPGGSVSVKFVGSPGETQVALIVGFSVFDPPLPGAYGDWYIAPPMILLTGLGPILTGGVYTVSGMLPATVPGPYTLYLQAMIGYQLTNLCEMNVQ